jgi:plasmid maintenance system antidote protein VapI
MAKAHGLMAPVHPGETALRLARYFKTNAEFWLNLQNVYDLERERRAGTVSEIDRQVQPVEAD